jgi:Protein of unknown function, DUF624
VSSVTSPRREWGEGPLARASAFIYTLLVTEVLFLLTALPGLVPLVLLDRDASNLPLVAACALPLGPALAAALFALHHRSRDLADLHPAAAFWRGYRLNFLPVLRIWAPWLVWLAVVAVTLANFTAAGVPGWWAVLLVAVAVGATLWMANALVITSLFAFRTLDLARLAAYFLARTPATTLGNACLLVVAAGVTWWASEAVLVLLVPVFGLFMLRTCDPMITEVRREFIE